MMDVSERTMRRVARELHDDLGQALTAVKLERVPPKNLEHQIRGGVRYPAGGVLLNEVTSDQPCATTITMAA